MPSLPRPAVYAPLVQPSRVRRPALSGDIAVAALASAGAVALVTAALTVLERWIPVLSLGALYVLAVLPVAIAWGALLAVPVAVASMLAFNFFLLPPRHTFHLRESENWLALVVYLAVALAASWLAARARQQARAAERRERDASLLADAAATLLGASSLAAELPAVGAAVADALGATHARITLGGKAVPGELPLRADGRVVGSLALDEPGRALADGSVRGRLLPALAALLALADERERLEQEARDAEALRRSDATKTALLRSVSHDLRSPLTAISTAADALASTSLTLGEDDRAALLATVVEESARLGRLVADLLDLSRLEAGAARPQLELHAVDELVAIALEELHGDPRVVVDLSDELPPVTVDAGQLRRALVNVLENALVHGGPTGPVRVTARAAGGLVRLLVADDGPGIPPGEVEEMFEPFRRGQSSAGSRGSGLGLAIARGFVEANGGTLRALRGGEPDSGAGSGAVLAFELPAAPAPVREPA